MCETTFPLAGFEVLHMDIQEPAPGENVQQSEFIEISVERRDGTRGVVEVRWVATIDGKPCISLQQENGQIIPYWNLAAQNEKAFLTPHTFRCISQF